MDPTHAPPHERETALAKLVAQLVEEIEPLQHRSNEAVWMASVTGASEHVEESARLDTQIRKIYARREPFEFLRRTEEAGGVPDPKLQRQLVLLLHQFRAHQISAQAIERMVRLEKSLDQRFNTFRAEWNGKRVTDNEIRGVLRNSTDSSDRRRAWEASKQIGNEVVGELLELVAVRNEAAHGLGFDNYYSMMLALDELDEAELFNWLDQLERGTRSPFESYKRELDAQLVRRFGVGEGDLRPWHYADPFFQEAPAAEVDFDPLFRDHSLAEMTQRFFSAIGLDIRDVMQRSDLYEKPGKSQHAFCISMDRRADVRVLCNLVPNEFWMSTMLHEFGHAAYDKYLDPDLPFVLRVPAHTLTTEASAMLFGRLSKNAAWLRRYAGMGEDEARRAAPGIARAVRSQLLVQTRWCLVMCHMERALYRDPAVALNHLWWDLVERLQEVHRPEARDAPDWASKIHFSVAPVYYHNYILGEIVASQLQSFLHRKVLGARDGVWDRYVESPEVGEYLKTRLYRPGKSMDWREVIRHATGEPLSPSALVDDLAVGGAPSTHSG